MLTTLLEQLRELNCQPSYIKSLYCMPWTNIMLCQLYLQTEKKKKKETRWFRKGPVSVLTRWWIIGCFQLLNSLLCGLWLNGPHCLHRDNKIENPLDFFQLYFVICTLAINLYKMHQGRTRWQWEKKERSVRFCTRESQSQAMISRGTENLDSHLPCWVAQGTANVAGPLVLLTQCVLINLGFEGLDLKELCGLPGAWWMKSLCSLSTERWQKGLGPLPALGRCLSRRPQRTGVWPIPNTSEIMSTYSRPQPARNSLR